MPLHATQRLVAQKEEYSNYIINMRPDDEFQREMLRVGSDVEVLSPQWLRDEIHDLARKRYTGLLVRFSLRLSHRCRE